MVYGESGMKGLQYITQDDTRVDKALTQHLLSALLQQGQQFMKGGFVPAQLPVAAEFQASELYPGQCASTFGQLRRQLSQGLAGLTIVPHQHGHARLAEEDQLAYLTLARVGLRLIAVSAGFELLQPLLSFIGFVLIDAQLDAFCEHAAPQPCPLPLLGNMQPVLDELFGPAVILPLLVSTDQAAVGLHQAIQRCGPIDQVQAAFNPGVQL
ncbi:hypothetical protein D3C78_1210330 [compost metagenome]